MLWWCECREVWHGVVCWSEGGVVVRRCAVSGVATALMACRARRVGQKRGETMLLASIATNKSSLHNGWPDALARANLHLMASTLHVDVFPPCAYHCAAHRHTCRRFSQGDQPGQTYSHLGCDDCREAPWLASRRMMSHHANKTIQNTVPSHTVDKRVFEMLFHTFFASQALLLSQSGPGATPPSPTGLTSRSRTRSPRPPAAAGVGS